MVAQKKICQSVHPGREQCVVCHKKGKKQLHVHSVPLYVFFFFLLPAFATSLVMSHQFTGRYGKHCDRQNRQRVTAPFSVVNRELPTGRISGLGFFPLYCSPHKVYLDIIIHLSPHGDLQGNIQNILSGGISTWQFIDLTLLITA